MDPFRLIIDGRKIPTKQCFEVLNPATEKPAGLAPLAGEAELMMLWPPPPAPLRPGG